MLEGGDVLEGVGVDGDEVCPAAGDDAADVFMRAFHAAWKKGTSASDAMRAATDAVRRTPKLAHPYYWAGWVLWGLQN